jgi:hypothetical protein
MSGITLCGPARWRLVTIHQPRMSRPLLVHDMLATSARLFSCLQKFIEEALGDGQLIVNTTHLFRFNIW